MWQTIKKKSNKIIARNTQDMGQITSEWGKRDKQGRIPAQTTISDCDPELTSLFSRRAHQSTVTPSTCRRRGCWFSRCATIGHTLGHQRVWSLLLLPNSISHPTNRDRAASSMSTSLIKLALISRSWLVLSSFGVLVPCNQAPVIGASVIGAPVIGPLYSTTLKPGYPHSHCHEQQHVPKGEVSPYELLPILLRYVW